MSSDVVIRVENLGKMYRIGGPQVRYSTFRETLVDAFAAPFRRAGRLLRGQGSAADLDHTIWALKDISFEVKRGEVVGIIGRNGAGKSTLLKILSRITEPTEGEADIYGRVGSLLEVGTGFHPELTGRENIYLNGAILGMRRAEIDRKLDEIVAFAEIERFLDTPVKHYSSGMYVRLAFAVAAHLEPEILLVDEVLAVGDAAFQKKCLGKMRLVSEQGRTVLFVSHNLAAVESLCSRGLVLDSGAILSDGETATAISDYLKGIEQRTEVPIGERADRSGSGLARIAGIRIVEKGLNRDTVVTSRPISVEIAVEAESPPVKNLEFMLTITDLRGVGLVHMNSRVSGDPLSLEASRGTFVCEVEGVPLNRGEYLLNACIRTPDAVLDHIVGASHFWVEMGDFFRSGREMRGSSAPVLVQYCWKAESEPVGLAQRGAPGCESA